MNAIIAEATKTTPKIVIDPANNVFRISGESRPENASKFYTPIITLLDEYRTSLAPGAAKKLSFDFNFEYFNSTSAKFILDIFFQLQKFHKAGFEAEIIWNYDKRDTDMKESGEEFSKYVPEVPVKYVEY